MLDTINYPRAKDTSKVISGNWPIAFSRKERIIIVTSLWYKYIKFWGCLKEELTFTIPAGKTLLTVTSVRVLFVRCFDTTSAVLTRRRQTVIRCNSDLTFISWKAWWTRAVIAKRIWETRPAILTWMRIAMVSCQWRVTCRSRVVARALTGKGSCSGCTCSTILAREIYTVILNYKENGYFKINVSRTYNLAERRRKQLSDASF